ncbi:Hpr(Ser) kinase/phosphatase [Rhizobium sp. RU20A]|uniref:HPr kinase/phosphorylase n=1 Tax=Rhizobium sp. RU20A TaxID=1907412 RepID=UPI000953C687|nr:HPr kinase/phosphorylase [Rhizobium sp. RU20A]SIQ83171.1 Hpr(Ser) kinase/phosphatase [Rhizobium sp. RU20A]
MTAVADDSATRFNTHATGIVTGETGIMIVGPSGSGKSALAYACLVAARRAGLFSALVGDDRLDIAITGDAAIMRGPSAIAGLLEIRGAGILRHETIHEARIDLVVRPVDPARDDRLPPDDERFDLGGGLSRPLIRVPRTMCEPLSLIFDLARQRHQI